MDVKNIKSEVRKKYANLTKDSSCCGSQCCSGNDSQSLVDYVEITKDITNEANLGLGCGLPILSVQIKPGDVVLDLGSGAGVDVFLAAKKVGDTGKVIGVDITPEMIELAKKTLPK